MTHINKNVAPNKVATNQKAKESQMAKQPQKPIQNSVWETDLKLYEDGFKVRTTSEFVDDKLMKEYVDAYADGSIDEALYYEYLSDNKINIKHHHLYNGEITSTKHKTQEKFEDGTSESIINYDIDADGKIDHKLVQQFDDQGRRVRESHDDDMDGKVDSVREIKYSEDGETELHILDNNNDGIPEYIVDMGEGPSPRTQPTQGMPQTTVPVGNAPDKSEATNNPFGESTSALDKGTQNQNQGPVDKTPAGDETPAAPQQLQKLIQEQEDVLENYTNENKLTNASESEWHTPTVSHTRGTVMRTVRNDDGSYYEEYKNPDTGRTYISYDAKGNRTGGSWNTIINGTEYPTRKEWTDSEGNYRAVNIVYDEQGNVLKEYGDDEDYEPIPREIKK